MNGYTDHNLNEDNFGPSKGVSLKSFDAFPKTKATYLTQSRSGGAWTLLLIVASVSLFISEVGRWWAGTTHHTFSVEKGVSHTMQMNLDVVVMMQCDDLHVNVQDAAGDRVLAAEVLKKDKTNWATWTKKGDKKLNAEKVPQFETIEDVHDFLTASKGRRRFGRTPRVRGNADACRIYGSFDSNKVQGDFHITARGHGYMEFGQHLSHDSFNFTHHVNELSFGPYYPSLNNPLDETSAYTLSHFYKFQYYLSIVPTIYTEDPAFIRNPDHIPPDDPSSPLSQSYNPGLASRRRQKTIWTNQYAVTEQSHQIGENAVPGIFVKYDIEPILLLVSEEMGSGLSLIIRLINVLAGIFVASGWCFQITEWAQENWGKHAKLSRTRSGMGMLHGQEEKRAFD